MVVSPRCRCCYCRCRRPLLPLAAAAVVAAPPPPASHFLGALIPSIVVLPVRHPAYAPWAASRARAAAPATVAAPFRRSDVGSAPSSWSSRGLFVERRWGGTGSPRVCACVLLFSPPCSPSFWFLYRRRVWVYIHRGRARHPAAPARIRVDIFRHDDAYTHSTLPGVCFSPPCGCLFRGMYPCAYPLPLPMPPPPTPPPIPMSCSLLRTACVCQRGYACGRSPRHETRQPSQCAGRTHALPTGVCASPVAGRHPPSAATRRSPLPRDPPPPHPAVSPPRAPIATRVDAAPAAAGLPVCSRGPGGRSGTDCCRPLSVMHTLPRGLGGRKPRRGTGGPPLLPGTPPPTGKRAAAGASRPLPRGQRQ